MFLEKSEEGGKSNVGAHSNVQGRPKNVTIGGWGCGVLARASVEKSGKTLSKGSGP